MFLKHLPIARVFGFIPPSPVLCSNTDDIKCIIVRWMLGIKCVHTVEQRYISMHN